MASRRTKKSVYPSRYGGGHVTIAQYITEYLCENIARSRKQELPTKFWEIEEWAKFFRMQIVLLNRQILPYVHPRAVVKSLKDHRCKFVTSFGGFTKVEKWKQVLVEYDRICKAEDEREAKMQEHKAPDATLQKPRVKEGSIGILAKLRGIENGKEEESRGERRDNGNSS